MTNYGKTKILGSLFILLVVGCANLNDPYYPSSSYPPPDPYYGSRYDDSYYARREAERAREERRNLERERVRLEEERRRAERERQQLSNRPPPAQEYRCPSGFSPSERKCTDQERKKGCKDMRLPNGVGCVKR